METIELVQDEKFGTLPLNDNLRKKALQAVIKRIDSVRNYHDSKNKEFDIYENMYSSESTEKSKETLSNINSRQVWNSVEDWTATIMDAVLSVDPPIKVKPKANKTVGFSQTLSEDIRKVLWKNAKESNFEENLELGVREGVKLGTFAFKVCFQYDEESTLIKKSKPKTIEAQGIQIPIKDEAGNQVNRNYMEEEIVSEARVPLMSVDIRNLYFRKDKISWIVEEIITNWDVIDKHARLYKLYTNIDNAKKTSFSGIDIEDNTMSSVISIDKDVKLWAAHHIPITFEKDDGIPELDGKAVLCIVSVINESEVIGVQASPYRQIPYIIQSFIPRKGGKEVYGIGVIEAVKTLVIEFNTRRLQSLDANTFGLYGMIIANTKYLKKPDQLKITPNGVIEVKGVDRPLSEIVQFIRPPVEYVSAAFNINASIEAEISRTTRLKGILAGEKISPNPSATEASAIIRESMKSVKLILKRIDRNIIAEYFKRAYKIMVLWRQTPWYIPSNDPMVIQEITPEQIYTDGIDVEMLGVAHTQDEAVTRNQNMQKIDLMMKYAPQPVKNDQGQLVQFNFFKAINDLLASFGDTKESDWWTPVPEPPMMGSIQTPPPPPGVTFINQPNRPGLGSQTAPNRHQVPTPYNGLQREQQMRKSAMNAPSRGV